MKTIRTAIILLIEFEIKTLTFDEYIGIKKFFGKTIDIDKDVEFIKHIFAIVVDIDNGIN